MIELTFADVCWEWWDFKLKRNKGDMPRGGSLHTANNVLERDVVPMLGFRRFNDIKRSDLIKLIRKIEERDSPETVKKTCSYLKQIYNFAMMYDYCDSNLADNISAIIINRGVKKNNPYLELKDIPEFKKRLNNVSAYPQIKKALWFMLFTGARGCEIRHSELKHFDLDNRIWKVPAINIKQLRNRAITDKSIPDYLMPLSGGAVEVLESAIEFSYGDKYIFCSPYKADMPININALNDLIRKMGYSTSELTSHGLRATMSTALYDSGLFKQQWIESQLTHADQNRVRGAYNHAAYLEKRSNMMDWWCSTIQSI